MDVPFSSLRPPKKYGHVIDLPNSRALTPEEILDEIPLGLDAHSIGSCCSLPPTSVSDCRQRQPVLSTAIAVQVYEATSEPDGRVMGVR